MIRRLAALCSLMSLSALAGESTFDPQAVPAGISFTDALKDFNARAASDPIGKDQPPLTEAAIAAAIRWNLATDKLHGLISEETVQTLNRLIETRGLPMGYELEYATGYQPNDRVEITVWSVRLRIPAIPQGSTCLAIEEKIICSRLIGEEERKVFHQWEKKMKTGMGSFERIEWEERLATARAKDEAAAKSN